MKHSRTSKILSTTLALALCGLTQTAVAWQNPAPQDRPLQNQSQVPQQIDQKAQPVEQPRDPNPSLKERKDEDQKELPNAPSTTPQTVTNGQQQPATTPPQKPQNVQPLGTAAAESGKTVGGPASRPAGMAIAPVKQKRTRSLLLKVGAILGGAAALGTVYALSKSSSSVPPNSGR
jgi:hypothetical protein